jgi:hypothetical protein
MSVCKEATFKRIMTENFPALSSTHTSTNMESLMNLMKDKIKLKPHLSKAWQNCRVPKIDHKDTQKKYR